MRFIAATVDRPTAWRRLNRRGLIRRIREALSRRGPGSNDGRTGLPRLELLWLPYYLVRFPARHGEWSDELLLLASAHDGAATLIDVRGLAWEESSERECFAATVGGEVAIEAAARVLLAARARGSAWKAAKIEIGTPQADLVHYPFWAYYFAPRIGILDVSLLDAWSGRPAGARVKVALLAALAAKKRTVLEGQK